MYIIKNIETAQEIYLTHSDISRSFIGILNIKNPTDILKCIQEIALKVSNKEMD